MSVLIPVADLVINEDLHRSGTAIQFEDRLKASIQQIGLAEPLKVALLPSGKYLVVDGILRLQAIKKIRQGGSSAFEVVPAYITDYERRYEIRYQTDIYQDLLPSQLAGLVEHLHEVENVRKSDIAGFIGVSPATLRNYTGLWRLLQRGGLFARIVELMDAGVLPASNPYAWLRLSPLGIRRAIEDNFADGGSADAWLDQRVLEARQGNASRVGTKYVEVATDSLPAECYREAESMRMVKRDLGLRRGTTPTLFKTPSLTNEIRGARHRLDAVVNHSSDRVLQEAARALLAFLK